ncbi:MAG: tryptophan 7-halogenase, partial [Verrucomicrobiota bacterium]
PSTQTPHRIRRVLVLGGGSAGFLAAITLKARMPVLDVTVLHSSKIPIIGVGEGSTLTMPIFLHGYLGIDPGHFHQTVKPTYKLGIRFLWGPRQRFHYTFTSQLDGFLPDMPRPNGFYCFDNFDFGDVSGALAAQDMAFERQQDGGPAVHTNVAYHLENESFVNYLEQHAQTIGVKIVDNLVEEVQQDDDGIKSLTLADGETIDADLYIDCSGFRSEFLGQTFKEPFDNYESSLPCNRAVAGGWSREEEPLLPFTTAETMEAGWAWQIEHDEIINRGYVYSSAFISDDEAESEFRRKNPKVKDTRVIKFDSGAYQRSWIKNVVALGNSSGFVEPLEATALAVICDHAAKLVHTLADSGLDYNETSTSYYNKYCERTWKAIRRFLAMHYKYNTRIDNAFWKHCWNDIDLAGAEEIVDYYQACGPSTLWANWAMGMNDPFSWEGYLVMLVGQKVPHQKSDYAPSEPELQAWNNHQRQLSVRASNGLNMRQSLDMIRSPQWGWRPDFYASANRW